MVVPAALSHVHSSTPLPVTVSVGFNTYSPVTPAIFEVTVITPALLNVSDVILFVALLEQPAEARSGGKAPWAWKYSDTEALQAEAAVTSSVTFARLV